VVFLLIFFLPKLSEADDHSSLFSASQSLFARVCSLASQPTLSLFFALHSSSSAMTLPRVSSSIEKLEVLTTSLYFGELLRLPGPLLFHIVGSCHYTLGAIFF